MNQLAWKAAETFNVWRAIIEATGCYVIFQKFDLEESKGFALYDDANTPMIVISKVEDYDPARTFTLIHEYCHLLLREPGVSDQNNDNPVEAYCNRIRGWLPDSSVRLTRDLA